MSGSKLMRVFFLLGFLVFITTIGSSAEPGSAVPWAQPQTFPDQNDQNFEVPLFERAMKEERRRKEQGITETVNVESLSPNVSPNLSPNLSPRVSPTATHNITPKTEEFKTLEKPTKGPLVVAAQQALLSLGFGLPAGADGDFGGQTVSAVKAFQSSLNVPTTGKLDKTTFEILMAMKPRDGKPIWEDPVAASKSIPKVPVIEQKKARVLIDLSEHRLCVYDSSGQVQRVFPVANGADETPTDVGIKVVSEKLADPTALAEKLWPDSKGAAFGKRLIDLNWYDVRTGSQTVSDEELHGTYVLDSIGSKASHGCVRLTNESIEWLFQNLAIGDIVVIRE
jgi:lipoprotein-anchoring transpeptidase ErfK/SrfK